MPSATVCGLLVNVERNVLEPEMGQTNSAIL